MKPFHGGSPSCVLGLTTQATLNTFGRLAGLAVAALAPLALRPTVSNGLP